MRGVADQHARLLQRFCLIQEGEGTVYLRWSKLIGESFFRAKALFLAALNVGAKAPTPYLVFYETALSGSRNHRRSSLHRRWEGRKILQSRQRLRN